MKIVVSSPPERTAILQQQLSGAHEWLVADDWATAAQQTGDLYVNLAEDAITGAYSGVQAPVLIHAVTDTLTERHLPATVLRINAWPGFLERTTWEIAGANMTEMEQLATALGKPLLPVADIPGFIAARVLAGIINEAYFTLGDGVSTKTEIDIAMKMGTNYPYGPFEWAEKIGLAHIHALLVKMAITDPIYIPAPAMSY
jgi:3-hydroxybutyryl-CoA dehydrogenase